MSRLKVSGDKTLASVSIARLRPPQSRQMDCGGPVAVGTSTSARWQAGQVSIWEALAVFLALVLATFIDHEGSGAVSQINRRLLRCVANFEVRFVAGGRLSLRPKYVRLWVRFWPVACSVTSRKTFQRGRLLRSLDARV